MQHVEQVLVEQVQFVMPTKHIFLSALGSKWETNLIFTPMLQALPNTVEHLRIESCAGEQVQESKMYHGVFALHVKPCTSSCSITSSTETDTIRIALIHNSLQRQQSRTKHVASITNIEQLKRFKLDEETMFEQVVLHLVTCQVQVVYCTGMIHDTIAYFLNKHQIIGYANIDSSLLLDLAHVSHATMVHQWQHLQIQHVGHVQAIIQQTMLNTSIPTMHVQPIKDKTSSICTLLVRAATQEFCNEFVRHVEDAWQSYKKSLGKNMFGYGGGTSLVYLTQEKKVLQKCTWHTCCKKQQKRNNSFAKSLVCKCWQVV